MEAVERNGAVELSAQGGPWLMRLQSTHDPATTTNKVGPAAVALVGTLGETLAPVASLMRTTVKSGEALRVAFSPDVQRGIAQGTLRLMGGGQGSGYPVAVNQFGRIREVATVMPAGGVLAGPALLPIVLPAVAALELHTSNIAGWRSVSTRSSKRCNESKAGCATTTMQISRPPMPSLRP